MTFNHVPLILAFRTKFRNTFRTTCRMTFRVTHKMTFKIWGYSLFKQDFDGDFEGYIKETSRGCIRGGIDLRVNSKGDCRRVFKQDMTCCPAQVRSRSGLV